MSVGFQWEEEACFYFNFLNTRPFIDGNAHLPRDNSDEWKLVSAAVVRQRIRTENGELTVVKTFEKPFVLYDYRIGKAEQPGAVQPATQPADKPPVKDQPSTPTSKDGPQ